MPRKAPCRLRHELERSSILNHLERTRSRRNLLRQLSCLSLGLPLARAAAIAGASAPGDKYYEELWGSVRLSYADLTATLSPQDEKLLDDLERASFQFFWEQANPHVGLIKDRCNVRAKDDTLAASIASTGFGLTAICIGDHRGFIPHAEARLRVLRTLSFLWHKLPAQHGFFYHFANVNTGERMWDSEVSSVDTAILLCGVLTCRQHFKDRDIDELAHAIFDRVDWPWLSEDTSLVSQGWTPEFGFIPSRWGSYSELMMIYLLGMASWSHPLAQDTWKAWKRPIFEYDGMRYIGSFAPLFVYQYSQAWFDFRHKRDLYADYFLNSAVATDVHRRFCVSLHPQFSDYSDALWGITASDSAHGYVVWGGPPATGPIDGTIVPCAAGGSLSFRPATTLRVLRTIRDRFPQAWCRYGFVDAFNPLTGWYDTDVIGIDLGITMLMAENLRTGFVWNTFMKNPEARRGMALAGFQPYNSEGA